jgi:hypothetical protein
MAAWNRTDAQLLQLVLEHVLAAGVEVERGHRDLEHVYRLSDPHPAVTVGHVYSRLGVAAARLQTASEQLLIILERVPDPPPPGRAA